MRIETMWLSDAEAFLAINSLLKGELYNDVMGLCQIDKCLNGEEVMDLVNSIDCGYFPSASDEDCKEEREKYVNEIDSFINNGEYQKHYAFFVKDEFGGFIKIDKGE